MTQTKATAAPARKTPEAHPEKDTDADARKERADTAHADAADTKATHATDPAAHQATFPDPAADPETTNLGAHDGTTIDAESTPDDQEATQGIDTTTTG